MKPKKNLDEVVWVCFDCGDIYLTKQQRYAERIFTCHQGECEICKETTAVAHVRHFNWLRHRAKDGLQKDEG